MYRADRPRDSHGPMVHLVENYTESEWAWVLHKISCNEPPVLSEQFWLAANQQSQDAIPINGKSLMHDSTLMRSDEPSGEQFQHERRMMNGLGDNGCKAFDQLFPGQHLVGNHRVIIIH